MISPDQQGPEPAELVRPYVITNGRQLPGGGRFDLMTLVTAAPGGPRPGQLAPEKRRLLDLCEGGYLTVAEIAGYLGLPLGVVRVLLSDLAEDGHLLTRAPVPPARLTDVQVLQEVLDGLQARFG